MHNRDRFPLRLFAVLALGSLVWACGSSSSSNGGGTGGEEETGGTKGDTGGKGGSGTGGKGTGGSMNTGGSSDTGGAGGSTGGAGGSTGGAGGETGGSGGNTGGAGGSTGGSGGNGGMGGSGGMGGMGGSAGPFKLTVTGALMQGGKYYFKSGQTKDTGHMSPAMEWTPVAGAMSYAISMVDTDNGNTHWVIYDIPPTVTKLPDNLMRGMQMAPEIPGAKHTRFSATNPYGYFGPGADCRTYNFTAYALKVASLPGVATATPSALRTGALANMANLLEKSPAAGVIGQTSGKMCQ
jgi:phosphatidylethanolamine-binding protein (PEBP) family uncharacterized protein